MEHLLPENERKLVLKGLKKEINKTDIEKFINEIEILEDDQILKYFYLK